MDKILLLGCNGFIGRHFQKYMLTNKISLSYEIVCTDKQFDEIYNYTYIKIDALIYSELEKLILDVEPKIIINLIGIYGSEDINMMFRINAEVPRNIFEIIKQYKLRHAKLLLIGSAAEYGSPISLPLQESAPLNPQNYYGLSKVQQALYASFYYKNYDIHFNIARTFNIIGENNSTLLFLGSVISQLRNAIDGGSITVGNLCSKRDYLAIDDVLAAFWGIILNGRSGETYNVCSGYSINMRDILDKLIIKSGKSIEIKTSQNLFRTGEIDDSYGDNSKLVVDTGWKNEKNIYEVLSTIN
jgi:GDP-4-dehydro-6-deoxy-D-mannose reductase